MRRMPILLTILLVAACATTGADGVDPPKWVDVPTLHPEASASGHLAAVGRAAGREGDPRAVAFANAVNQIAQMIEVQVQGVLVAETESLLVDGDSSTTERLSETVRLVASQDLPGAAQVDSWQHPRTGEYFALVAVPRELLVRTDLDTMVREMESATTSLETADALGDSSPGRSLTHRLEAYDALARAEAHAARARTVAFGGPLQRSADEQLARVRQRLVVVQGDLQRKIGQLRLLAISGDDQKGHVGARLELPLVARVEYAADDGSVRAIPDFPARFASRDGEHAQLAASSLTTDAAGQVACTVTDLSNTGRAANTIAFVPDLQRIAPSWPESRIPTLAFQYRLPTPGQTRILLAFDTRYDETPLDDGRLQADVAGHLSKQGFVVQTSRPEALAADDELQTMTVDALRARLGASFDYVLRGSGTAHRGDKSPPLQMFRLEASLEIVPLDAGRARVVATGEIKGGGTDDSPSSAVAALVRYASKPLMARLDSDFVSDFLPQEGGP